MFSDESRDLNKQQPSKRLLRLSLIPLKSTQLLTYYRNKSSEGEIQTDLIQEYSF